MPLDIGASGFVGIAPETTAGTYAAPTKFFPIRSESLAWTQDTNWRRVIRGTADVLGGVAGNGNVEGDIEMELLEDVLPHFLRAARGTITKTAMGGATPTHYEYAFVPSSVAIPPNTMSITVVRAGTVFSYLGCVVGGMNFGVDNDMATVTFNMLGRREAVAAAPVPAYNADDQPFGAGQWSIQIPTATQVFDADGFGLTINDNATAQNRLKNSLGAQFVSYGERDVELSLDRDFVDRTEYDLFKALTERSLRVRTEKSAEKWVQFTTPATIIDSYDVGLGGVGDLVRASITYRGTHDATAGGAYTMTVSTPENITI